MTDDVMHKYIQAPDLVWNKPFKESKNFMMINYKHKTQIDRHREYENWAVD